ncbi:hypothetical protein F5B20DRAFT_589424 [Whalleya microplaca]|nr:hypothetical protein F5B20DRAFT_589424 [Whalleya microplaca]
MDWVDEEGSAARLRTLFSDKNRFQFVTIIPGGATGYIFLFRERDPSTGAIRSFVVKIPNDDDVVKYIRNEIHWLEVLKHSDHIIDMLQVHNNPLLPDENGTGGLGADFMILEYLENGTLADFIDKAQWNTIPNRILWHIFLCMTRACVAMAYPPSEGQREDLRPVQPLSLSQWDMHTRNFMFDRMRLDKPEHSIMPALKLIDFDNAALMEENDVDPPDEDDVEAFDDKLGLPQ